MIHNISVVFISIFLESLPFLLLGSIISAAIEHFVSDETFEKIIPKNIILATLTGIFMGFFIPACDCAVIPISKRLIKKKVPINVAISFMLSSPIINPVVLLSTYYAFYKVDKQIFFLRLIFGVIISLIIGIIMGILFKDVIKNNKEEKCSCNHHHHHAKNENEKCDKDFEELKKYTKEESTLTHIIKHTANDLFEVVKYLMFGALIASICQVVMPRELVLVFSNNKILSIIVLMVFAYLISLCSTSDSFVGKSLLSTFGRTSILAYLLLGPMIDIKNTIVLLGNYKSKFVYTLISLIFSIIFILCVLVVIL